jgi:hypothetical protein
MQADCLGCWQFIWDTTVICNQISRDLFIHTRHDLHLLYTHCRASNYTLSSVPTSFK